MQLSKLLSFISVALLVAVVFAGLVSIPAVAQTNKATSTVAATTAVVTTEPTVVATPTIVAVTPTTTTISADTKPSVGQNVGFIGSVKAGDYYLLNKPVKIWHTTPDGKRWEDGTVTITTNGLTRSGKRLAPRVNESITRSSPVTANMHLRQAP